MRVGLIPGRAATMACSWQSERRQLSIESIDRRGKLSAERASPSMVRPCIPSTLKCFKDKVVSFIRAAFRGDVREDNGDPKAFANAVRSVRGARKEWPSRTRTSKFGMLLRT